MTTPQTLPVRPDPIADAFLDITVSAVRSVYNANPNVLVYFVEDEYFLSLFEAVRLSGVAVAILPLGGPLPPIKKRRPNEDPMRCIDPEDTVGVIGRPSELVKHLGFFRSVPSINLLFLSIPLLSYTLRIEIWKSPLSCTRYSSFCAPFLRCRHYQKLPLGNFSSLFLTEPIYELKALKASLAALSFRFGKFERVYAGGALSTSACTAFLDATSVNTRQANNILVLFDRTIDMAGIIEVNDTYQGYLEECAQWNGDKSAPAPQALAAMLRRAGGEVEQLPVFMEGDDVFGSVALVSLPDAVRRLTGAVLTSDARQRRIDVHRQLIQACYNFLQVTYALEVFVKVQQRQIDALKYGRFIAFADNGPVLAFRLLSVLRLRELKKEAQSIAEFLAIKFGVGAVARWDQIDRFLLSSARVEPPAPVQSITKEMTSLVSTFATVLLDKWQKNKYPVQPAYCSHPTPIPPGRYRWFVGVLGGMSATELRMMRTVAAKCRKDDKFVFFATSVMTPTAFMKEIVEL
jgi:hypothetical protein